MSKIFLISEKEIRDIVEEYRSIKTFKEQLEFLSEYNNILRVRLDNDTEYIAFTYECVIDADEEIVENLMGSLANIRFKMNGYFGNTEGVKALLQNIDITVDFV